MNWQPCCDTEEKEYSPKVELVADTLSSLLWKIRRECSSPEKSEEYTMLLLQKLWASKSIDALVETMLELEKKLKLNMIKQEEKEEKDEEGVLADMFEVVESEDE
jgi:hypothetical protein